MSGDQARGHASIGRDSFVTRVAGDDSVVWPADHTCQYQRRWRVAVFSGQLRQTCGIAIDNCSRRDTVLTNEVLERQRAEEALRQAFDEIKKLKDQLYRENWALRDEIDRASMFEEVVGTSPALQALVARIAKVAPTDARVVASSA